MAAFMVCSDRSLHELATKQPTTLSQLLEINGFGEAKVEAYGEGFLQAINEA
ncbi:MAG: HRDC domain-containing protein [Opitutales bacterium]